jgi:hypothetical protein
MAVCIAQENNGALPCEVPRCRHIVISPIFIVIHIDNKTMLYFAKSSLSYIQFFVMLLVCVS